MYVNVRISLGVLPSSMRYSTSFVATLLASFPEVISCGVTDTITSPTFSYVNMYRTADGKTFYHFDLYRVDSLQTFHNLGLDEYLSQDNSWVFIEWPQVIDSLLGDDVCRVEIGHVVAEKRRRMDYLDDKRVCRVVAIGVDG